MSYYTDERMITSRDALNRYEFKVKLLEIVENARDPTAFKFGGRVLVKKVLVIVRNLKTNEVEEKELDLEDIESEIRSKRKFSSANRWVAPSEIRNGYIVGYRHVDLLASAIALDYITI